MKSPLAPLLPILALALLPGGCQNAEPPPDSKVLFAVIEENMNAMEKKDLEAVMATIHSKSPTYESTRELLKQMFAAVDVKCTLSDLRVVTATPDEARVSFSQTMKKTAGEAPFLDNIVSGVHTLRPDNGKWKIYRTVQTSVTGLDGKPLGATGPEAAPAAPSPAVVTPAPAAGTPAPAAAPEAAPKPAAPPQKPAQ